MYGTGSPGMGVRHTNGSQGPQYNLQGGRNTVLLKEAVLLNSLKVVRLMGTL